jgi:DNA (cytosine-5)-methyltransferase 1
MLTALDLFCGAGGASTGLHRAGFDVTGIDHKPQPRYPFRFIQADALCPPVRLADFDFVWASPPCQRWTAMVQQTGMQERHPDLIAPIRAMLAGRVHCIENVPRAPLRTTLILSGDMFGACTYRLRHFELSFVCLAPEPGAPFGPKSRPGSVTVAGSSGGKSNRDQWQNGAKAAWQAAMGIDWMLNREMSQAVPPAYAEFIGRAAISHIRIGAAP